MLKAAGVIVGLLILASVLWVGGELHYRNCIDAAKAEISGLAQPARAFASTDGTLSRRVRGCSRLPL